jgi:hypothetical protein
MTAHRLPRAVAALLVAAVTALAAAAVPAPAGAAPGDEFRWAVQPSDSKGPGSRSQFTYDLAPGQQIDDHVAVTNLSTKPLTFTVYATDAFTSTDGAFALPPASQSAREAGSWVKLERKAYTLRAGDRVVLPFRLSVPSNATPGDHAGGIIASVTEQQTNAEGQRVNVDRRVGTRVYLRVSGPLNPTAGVESVEVSYDNPLLPFARGPMTVTYRLRNTGNVRVTGKARLRATGLFGIPLSGGQEVTLPEMLPGAEVVLVCKVDGVVPAAMITGRVEVDAATSEGPLRPVTRTESVWTVPWTLLYLLVVVGGVVTLLCWWWRRRRRAAGAGDDGAVDRRPDGDADADRGPAAESDGTPAATPVDARS